MQLSKLAIELSSPLVRWWTPKPTVLPILAASEIQSSPIFQLPDELFLEVFTNLPVPKWSDLYYRYRHIWARTPIHDFYGERTQVLLALSATCKAMRNRFLPEAWERSLMCRWRWKQRDQIPARLKLQCRTLTSNHHLAAFVRSMTVDLACDGTEAILKIFIGCLITLPNLHTLEIISMGYYPESLRRALNGAQLPQIRTLVLPYAAHNLLRHCPNADDLTYTPCHHDREFIESLVMGGQKLRRFAVMSPVNGIVWTELAQVCPDISELSLEFVYIVPSSARNCIVALQNLSTLQIVYHMPYEAVSPEEDWSDKIPKETGIEHLKTCSGTGPKVLRTVVLDRRGMSETSFRLQTRIEEIQVWKGRD